MSPSTLAWRPETAKNAGEKRRERSADPRAAAALYLAGVRRRCVLDGLLVTDDEGRVLASATDDEPTALAAAGVSVTAGDPDAGVDGIDVYAHRIKIGRDSAVLVSSGSRVDRVRVVERDLDRIFG